MKTLKYGYAVVSFCPDLTNPVADSIPLGGLLVGQVDDDLVAAVAWLEMPDAVFKSDPLAAAIMRDLPSVLRMHVDEAWDNVVVEQGKMNAAADSLLAELHHSLRNSLHVSEIATGETKVEQADDAPGILVGELGRRIREVVKRYLPEVSGPPVTAPASRPSRPVVSARAPYSVASFDHPKKLAGINYWPLSENKSKNIHDCHAE